MDRYYSINPLKDGATVKGPADLKNEMQIITLPDNIFAYWAKFLTKQADGELIEPVSMKKYNQLKGFKRKSMSLKKEFFRHCGHFTDKDFLALALHLLGETPKRKALHPKLSVPRTRILVADNMTAGDWMERRKRKKVILQDLASIKPALKFTDTGGDVIDATWRSWKARHRFTSATWDFLLSYPKNEYFKRRLTYEASGKRAKDLGKTYPEVFYMFTHFMKMKYKLPRLVGGVQVRGVDIIANALVTSNNFQYQNRDIHLAVLDVREILRAPGIEKTVDFQALLKFLLQRLEPKMNEPLAWLFILRSKADVKAATKFVALKLKDYDCIQSSYVPAKAEMLDNCTNRNMADDVPLLFLFKKNQEVVTNVRGLVKKEYETPAVCQYYDEVSKNTEAKWRIHPTELRMEFYLQILQDFATPEENVVGVFCGPKFMLAAKVGFYPCLSCTDCRLEDTKSGKTFLKSAMSLIVDSRIWILLTLFTE